MPKPPQCIAFRNLIAGIYPAKVRKGGAVYNLCNSCHTREVIKILKHISTEHQFQIIRFITTLSFEILQLHYANTILPTGRWDQFNWKALLAGLYTCEFIAEYGQGHLSFHIISYFLLLDILFFLCDIALVHCFDLMIISFHAYLTDGGKGWSKGFTLSFTLVHIRIYSKLRFSIKTPPSSLLSCLIDQKRFWLIPVNCGGFPLQFLITAFRK